MFRKIQISLFSILILLSWGCSAESESSTFQEGTQYKKVEKADPDRSKTTVSVTEFFSFGCPHCFHLEKDLHKWLEHKPENIKFKKVPAFWNEKFEMLARSYYIAEVNRMEDKINDPLFEAIHEKRSVRSEADVAALFEQYGLTADKFKRDYVSFAVDSKMKNAAKQFKEFGLRSVPVIVVGGVYYTDVSMAGGPDKLFEVVEFLANKLQKEKQ